MSADSPPTKGRLSDAFMADLVADWAAHGAAAIARVRDDKPDVYLKLITSVLPKELNVRLGELEQLSDEELDGRIAAIAGAIAADTESET